MRVVASSSTLRLFLGALISGSLLAGCGGSSSETPPPLRPDFARLPPSPEPSGAPSSAAGPVKPNASTPHEGSAQPDEAPATWGSEPAAEAPEDVKIDLKE